MNPDPRQPHELSYRRADPARTVPLAIRLLMGVTGPFVWVFLSALLIVAIWLVGSYGVVFFVGMIPAFIVLMILVAQRVTERMREQRGWLILMYVENAVRLNLPLVPFLDAAKKGESGAVARRMERLLQLLRYGNPLGDALRQAVPELPPRVFPLVLAGEQTGCLRQALHRLVVEYQRVEPREPEDQALFYRIYPFGLGLFLIVYMYGLTTFIFPKFREIYKDFHAVIPWQTQLLLSLSDEYALQLVLVVLLMGMLWLVVSSLGKTLAPRWPGLLPRSFRDTMIWGMPILGSLEANRGLADVNQVLADSALQGIPLPMALLQASELDINARLRVKIVNWSRRMQEGQPLGPAARAAGLPALMASLLETLTGPSRETSGDSTDAPQIFAFLARYYRGRFSRTAIVLRAAFEPAVVIAMGLVVCFVVMAVFVPLPHLINAVMGWDGRSPL